MLNQKRKGVGICVGYWSMVAIVVALMIVIQPTFAASETIWDRFSAIMRDFYGQIVTISTIVAVNSAHAVYCIIVNACVTKGKFQQR